MFTIKNNLNYYLIGALLSGMLWSLPMVAQPSEIEGNPLAPIKTDSPRDTMRSFQDAMNDYKKGVETGNADLQARLDDAVRTLNMEDTNVLVRKERGREAAIFLKEVIDRVLVVDLERVPHVDEVATKDNPEGRKVWRLRKTDIRIGLVEDGERAGEWLFTPGSVLGARNYFEKVKNNPYLEGSGGGAAYTEPWLEKNIPEYMRSTFLTLAWWQWAGLGIAILLGLVIKFIIQFLVGLLRKLASRSRSTWDDKIIDAVAGPIGYLAAAGFWYIALRILNFEDLMLAIFSVALKIFFSIIMIWLVYRLAEVLSDWLKSAAAKTESTLDYQLVPLLSRSLKIIVVILGVLIIIQNLGINVLSLLAGLGIGGLAFALAAKDTVANFFGSLMILFDRPFQVGDWIKVGGEEGTVEEIGFRSTRIRTFYNSVVSIPNSDVANTNIDNMGARAFRRVRTVIGVTYDTDPELLELFMEGIKNIIKANDVTRKDYFHVVFSGFGSSSLDIMLYFFLRVPDWNHELVERQNVYLEILRLARELKVDFAFPTQTLHIESEPEKKPTRNPTAVDAGKMQAIARDFGPKGTKARPTGQGHFVPPFKDEDLRIYQGESRGDEADG